MVKRPRLAVQEKAVKLLLIRILGTAGLIPDDAVRTMWGRLTERLVTQTPGLSTGMVEAGFTRLETRVWPEQLDSALDE